MNGFDEIWMFKEQTLRFIFLMQVY